MDKDQPVAVAAIELGKSSPIVLMGQRVTVANAGGPTLSIHLILEKRLG
jgi:hypothetical protein